MIQAYRLKKNNVRNFEFGDFVIDESDDLQSKKNETGSVRIDFSRSVIFNLFQRVLQEEIHFFTKTVTQKSDILFFLRG